MLLLLHLAFFACQPKEEPKPPQIITKPVEVSLIFERTVILTGMIDWVSGAILDHGFVWSTTPEPTLENGQKESLGASDVIGDYHAQVQNLTPGQRYYVRSYLVTNQGTVYGNTIDFHITTISGLSPGSAMQGDTVIISGANFSPVPADNSVTFGNARAEVVRVNQTFVGEQLTVVVPAGGTPGASLQVSITIQGQSSQCPQTFTLLAGLRKADFPGAARREAIGFTIGNRIYVGAGIAGSSQSNIRSDFWEYNSQTNSWIRRADFPGGVRMSAVSFVLDGKGYVCSGSDGYSNRNDLWEYNPVSNIWTRKADFPGTARKDAAGFAINGKAYLGLGAASGQLNSYSQYLQDFWEYNPSADVWTRKADYGGTGQTDAAAFVLADKAYVGKGTHFSGNGGTDFWEYTPGSDTWSGISSPEEGVLSQFPIAFTINNKGYLVRDEYTLHEFDAAGRTWRSVSLRTRTMNPKAGVIGVINNQVYNVTGQVMTETGQFLNVNTTYALGLGPAL